MSTPPLEAALHVLVVEDHPLLRGMLQRTLTSAAIRVTTAETGDEAVVLLESGVTPNVVLSDLRMPGQLDGLGLARWVQARYPTIPILLMTGFADEDTGSFRVLSKPFDPRTLVSAIREMASSAGNAAGNKPRSSE